MAVSVITLVVLGIKYMVGSIEERAEYKKSMIPYLIGAFLIGTILQVGVVVIPKIADIFDVVLLNNKQWIYTAIISILPLVIVEIQKKINTIRFERPVYKPVIR